MWLKGDGGGGDGGGDGWTIDIKNCRSRRWIDVDHSIYFISFKAIDVRVALFQVVPFSSRFDRFEFDPFRFNFFPSFLLSGEEDRREFGERPLHPFESIRDLNTMAYVQRIGARARVYRSIPLLFGKRKRLMGMALKKRRAKRR